MTDQWLTRPSTVIAPEYQLHFGCYFLFVDSERKGHHLMLRFFCFTMLLTLVLGCGSKNVGLKGKVTFSDDGNPLTVGTVGFRQDGKLARGNIKSDGTFVVGFEQEANGLPPGKYDVYISGAAVVVGQVPGTEEDIWEQLIDKKYASADTSGLSVTVDASTKVYNITVDRAPAPKKK